MDQEIITQDGEIIEAIGNTSSMAVQLQKAEVDQLITTARAYPRSLKQVQTRIMSLATLDEESAEECMYALPRGGKPIKGPSIRFAEILKQSFGNCRAAARVVAVDRTEMYVEAEGIFHDLETNSSTTARVRRRISGKNGKVFNDDMIIVTGNAACSIAMRNAILAGVPKPLWRRAYETVQATITGDVTTLSVNREKALKALAAFGVKPEQIFAALGRDGLEEITVDDIGTLRGMYSALKNGEATVEEMFFGTVKPASQHEKIADPLSDEPVKPADQTAADQTSEPLIGEIVEEATGERTDEETPVAGAEPSLQPAQEGGDGSANPSSSSSTIPDDLRHHFIDFARKALTTAADASLSEGKRTDAIEAMVADYREVIPESLWQKLSGVKIPVLYVITGQRTKTQAADYIARDLLECGVAEIGG